MEIVKTIIFYAFALILVDLLASTSFMLRPLIKMIWQDWREEKLRKREWRENQESQQPGRESSY
jgi:hypothetical protein